jgi:hypothetical protein
VNTKTLGDIAEAIFKEVPQQHSWNKKKSRREFEEEDEPDKSWSA